MVKAKVTLADRCLRLVARMRRAGAAEADIHAALVAILKPGIIRALRADNRELKARTKRADRKAKAKATKREGGA